MYRMADPAGPSPNQGPPEDTPFDQAAYAPGPQQPPPPAYPGAPPQGLPRYKTADAPPPPYEEGPSRVKGGPAINANGKPITAQPHTTVVIHERSGAEPQPNSYLMFSIFTCMCCNCIFGMITIILSMRSRKERAASNFKGAKAYGTAALVINSICVPFSFYFAYLFAITIPLVGFAIFG